MLSESPAPAGVTELPDGFRFDLADTLSRDAKLAPDLLQRARPAVPHPIAQLQHPPLPVQKRTQHLCHRFPKQLAVDCQGRGFGGLVLDVVARVVPS